jgi:ribonuclease R
LKIGFLKSLMRARYAVEPLGHYGLAKTKYTHFTSPIRRYADLMVHRALFARPGDHIGTQPLKVVCDHISDTERNSADAERDSKDVKLFAFLTAQLVSGKPQRYAALVTDVRNFGFFVDVPGLAMSGLVPLSTLTDDFFQFDSNRTQLVGRRSRRVIRLGDRLEVQVANVDRFKKQVDFRLADSAKAIGVKTTRVAEGNVNSRSRPQRFGRRQSQPQTKSRRGQGLTSSQPSSPRKGATSRGNREFNRR